MKLLVIEDETTRSQVPSWSPEGGPVTSAAGVVVLKVLHETDGMAVVHVMRASGDFAGTTVFDGRIDVPSRLLSIGDAGRDNRMRIDVPSGHVGLRIVVDAIEAPRHIDLVMD